MPHPRWGTLGSQAKTIADTMDLHRVPLLAARRPDAATVKRIGSSARRETRSLGDGFSHGFGTRGGGALLGFGDALIVAKLPCRWPWRPRAQPWCGPRSHRARARRQRRG